MALTNLRVEESSRLHPFPTLYDATSDSARALLVYALGRSTFHFHCTSEFRSVDYLGGPARLLTLWTIDIMKPLASHHVGRGPVLRFTLVN